MKFESTQAESSFALLSANLTTIVLGAFGNFEQTIQQLTDSIVVKDKTIAELKAKIHKLEPQPEGKPDPEPAIIEPVQILPPTPLSEATD